MHDPYQNSPVDHDSMPQPPESYDGMPGWAFAGLCACMIFVGMTMLVSHERSVHGQASSTPAALMAGIGTPAANGITCGVGMASAGTASEYLQRDIVAGNSIWKCTLGTDGVTYGWQAPFTAATPTILGSTASFGGSALLLGGSVSSTATVTGATQGSNCVATRADGTLLAVGLVIDCAVTATNTATVRISALIAGTPAAGVYNVRVIQ